MSAPRRVIMRVRVTSIPGNPQARVYRLGRDFCQDILQRPFNNNLQEEPHDAMHFLPNCDSENDVNAWFIYDFNVTGPLSKEEVLTIAHEVYHATRIGEAWWVRKEKLKMHINIYRIFTTRERWIDEGRKYCSMYKWGGSYMTE